jgi:hypothetical protein
MKIQTTNSVAENKIKCVVNGLSGAGKTSLVKTLVGAGYKPLIISAESGLLSLAGTGIDFVDITRDDNGALLPKEMRVQRLMEVYRFINTPEAKKKYDTIYPDSLTEICQCMFDALKKEYPDRKDSLVLYGELGQKMRDLIKAFRDVPDYHVVFTCLSKVEKDESGKRYVGFELIGSIADKLPQFFDEVFYLQVAQDGGRELLCNNTTSIITKDRSGKLSSTETADLGAVFNKILGTENKGAK